LNDITDSKQPLAKQTIITTQFTVMMVVKHDLKFHDFKQINNYWKVRIIIAKHILFASQGEK